MIYPSDVSPAITLYNHWYDLLAPHVDMASRRTPTPYIASPWKETYPYQPVSYGAYHHAIAIVGIDDGGRPIIGYGKWYRAPSVPYAVIRITADGHFLLTNTHGDNHQRISEHTFLASGWTNGQYVWWVNPEHGPYECIDFDDWRRPIMYHRERMIRGWYCWLTLERMDSGRWEIFPVDRDTYSGVLKDRERTLRRYEKAKRKEVGNRAPMVFDGPTKLNDDAAALSIAALLDVSQPARAVRMSKTREVV